MWNTQKISPHIHTHTHTHTHTIIHTENICSDAEAHNLEIHWRYFHTKECEYDTGSLYHTHTHTHTHTHIPPIHESSCWLTEECVCVLPLSLF